MAELIQKQDTLNEGREKLNAAITDAEKAKVDAGKAIDTSNQARQIAQTAENKADSVQAQFDQVVIEGDSSVEAAQARVPIEGEAYPTLKARLDAENAEVTSQLAQLALNVKSFGAVVDGETDDSQAVQEAIDYAKMNNLSKVVLPKGRMFFLKPVVVPSDITVEGAGLNVTIIDMKDSVEPAFTMDVPSINTLNQITNLYIGDDTIQISNNTSPGDHVVFASTNRFTSEWDGGTAIRNYYNKGEIFKIKDADSSSITFTEPSVFDLPYTSVKHVETFTPSRNIEFKDFSVVRNKLTTGASKGIHVKYAENVTLTNIGTKYTNHGGIVVDRSRDITITNYHGEGGTPDLGLNYGIVILDGSKNVNIDGVYALSFRHAISGGGTGYANPIGVVARNVFVSNSQLHSIDAHGNCMNFTFENCHVDNGLSLGGIGHSVKTLRSRRGGFSMYEGGKNLTFEDIKFERCNRLYTHYAVKDVVLRDIHLPLINISGFSFKSTSERVTFEKCRFENLRLDTVGTADEADALFPASAFYGIRMYQGFKILNTYLSGFAVGVLVDGNDCVIDDLTLVNCGWQSSLTSTDCALLIFNNSNNAKIKRVTISFNHPNLPVTTRVIMLVNKVPGTPCYGVSIQDVGNGAGHIKNYYYGMQIGSPDFKELFIQNVRPKFGSGGNHIDTGATGKFIYNTVVADN